MTMITTETSRIVLPDAPAEQQALLRQGGVACWREPVMIDTYHVGTPDRFPLFLDRRVYQGSSGRVYPLPMIDRIRHDKEPAAWDAIHLENEYVRLMLLPELGGRVHIGFDKVTGYDFFYRNNVIKPALVGLAGPWISGGVEFNWPQHHRPATYLPVDTAIEREDDGAVVVWHTDLDPIQRMRATHGIRLRPGSSLIEADVSLHNRTDTTQTFLWWANVAARSHERYQSFFPDDVGFVADHARRAITSFPSADRAYYGVDYPRLAAESPGADRIDFYGNIPVPTSYMITDTTESFFGGYDHEEDAGFVHWADRAVSPGKKQWTWGNGPIGHAWDEQLTDGDGPYVELMAGVYTDNQPDFSWILPGETKRFSQYWYPIHATGPVRQANREVALSVSQNGDSVTVSAIATEVFKDATMTLSVEGRIVDTWRGVLGPDSVGRWVVGRLPEGTVRIDVASAGNILLAWTDRSRDDATEPWVATAPAPPEEIGSNDELVLTATHLTQYRHPTRSAIPYLEEALRRDPEDSRASVALGALRLRQGAYEEAHSLFASAITRLTRRNLNPRDGEAHYLDGLALERLGRDGEADDRFSRAAWNAAWAPAARLARARIALRRGDAASALSLAREAGTIPEARRLVVLALRAIGDDEHAHNELAQLKRDDTLDWATSALSGKVTASNPRTLLDVAGEYARSGANSLAISIAEDLASSPSSSNPGFGRLGPLPHYLRALWLERSGDAPGAQAARQQARSVPTNLVFPAGLDQLDALRAAVAADVDDDVASGLLGMWLLDAGRSVDALAQLRSATRHGSADPVVWRNLALALVDSEGDLLAADEAFAVALRFLRDPGLVLERDVLAQLRGVATSERLRLMETEYSDLLSARDDLTLRHVNLLLDTGRIDDAWAILIGHTFRPFEGGEGQVIAAFDRASCMRARRALPDRPFEAIDELRSGFEPPRNLGEGRHPAQSMAERLVLLGDGLSAVGDHEAARTAWQSAAGATPLAVAPRETSQDDFWIGLALLRLDRVEEARDRWARLEKRADEIERRRDDVDYFATSLPELLLFDTDTPQSRQQRAALLRDLATRGRELSSP